MRYAVRVTRRAKDAIDRQVGYIAHDRQSPRNAGLLLGAIDDAVASLSSMPHRGAKAPEDAYVDYTVRMLVIKKSFLLLYRIDEQRRVVTVVGFRHGRRRPRPQDLPEDENG